MPMGPPHQRQDATTTTATIPVESTADTDAGDAASLTTTTTTTTTTIFQTLLVPLSCCLAIWVTFPLVTVTNKCLLTEIEPCTRWGGSGAGFHFPMTVACLNLLIVGGALSLRFVVMEVAETETQHNNVSNNTSNDNTTNHVVIHRRPAFHDKLEHCGLVGLVFGAKYVVAHWALQVTPTVTYELFHCLNIVFVALAAYLVLGERLQTRVQLVACLGIVVGSLVMSFPSIVMSLQADDSSNNHDDDNDGNSGLSLFAVAINLLNGTLAGLCVVLLRRTMLHSICESAVEVTAMKMLSGGLLLLVPALLVDGDALMHISLNKILWLFLSSLAILVYHVNLTILCGLSTSTTVGMIEALRPAPAFGVLVLVQGGSGGKGSDFWIGSGIILVSTIVFELSGRMHEANPQQNGRKRQHASSSTKAALPSNSALQEWDERHRRRAPSIDTEHGWLLDGNGDDSDSEELFNSYLSLRVLNTGL